MPDYSGSISYGGGGNMRGVQTGPSPGITIGGQQGAFADPRGFLDYLLRMRDRRQASPPTLATHDSMTGIQNQLAQEQLEQAKIATREANAQLQARMGPMPTKMMWGFNVIPGRIADPNAMNYYQRQAYLPQEAGMPNAPGPSPAGLEGGVPLNRPGGFGTGGSNWETGTEPERGQQLTVADQTNALTSMAQQQMLAQRMHPGLYGRIMALSNPKMYLPTGGTSTSTQPSTTQEDT